MKKNLDISINHIYSVISVLLEYYNLLTDKKFIFHYSQLSVDTFYYKVQFYFYLCYAKSSIKYYVDSNSSSNSFADLSFCKLTKMAKL